MRLLFAVDSFFQLILAINLRMTLYKNSEADIAIYGSTPNALNICENLAGLPEKEKLFQNCYYLNTPLIRCGNHYTFFQKFPKYFIYLYTMINPVGYSTKNLSISNLYYDQFLFCGSGALPECIFNAIIKTNNKIECYRFEDGYVSYTREYGKIKSRFRVQLERVVRFIFNGYNLEDHVNGYYMETPDLVQIPFKYPILKAPKISRESERLISLLNEIFNYKSKENDCHEKYIYFESGDSFFEKNSEDIEFVKILADIVGDDQVLVKRHPRFQENRFKDIGVRVMETSHIPWELIQLNQCMNGKVFITTTSSAALSSEIYFGDKSKRVMLFEVMKNKTSSVTDLMRNYMYDFQNKYGKNNLYIPHSIYEYRDIILGL